MKRSTHELFVYEKSETCGHNGLIVAIVTLTQASLVMHVCGRGSSVVYSSLLEQPL